MTPDEFIIDELFKLFTELDAVILDHLPDSLFLTPARLIQAVYEAKTGLYLTIEEIADAYQQFLEEESYE